MIEYLMVFPERDAAEEVAEELADDDFGSVRVLSEALAGEDDAEDVNWVVHVVQDTVDDPAGAVARALSERFSALAEEHDGWLDDDRSTGG
ncbi:ribonuclease E inhibitor RraB [Flexivirga meconopsidis]|uniref:ribonuclease E inhibitor RraB n=1 Tax=Flexivirga meconopsidis TaxID=2977121 RepID=UPI00223F3952